MNRACHRYWILLAGLCLALSACAPGQSPWLLLATPSETPLRPSPTVTPVLSPTPTIVWFPATATFTPYPTARPAEPTEELRPGLGSVILVDSFDPDAPWMLSSQANGSVALGKNELSFVSDTADPKDDAYLYSLRDEPVLADFYLEITANPVFCQGRDEYGLIIRYDSGGSYYRFGLSCDGYVRLDRLAGGENAALQPWVFSGAVPVGAPSLLRLGVWANGSEMRFFINDELQFSLRDPKTRWGRVGVFARSTGGHNLTVNFSNLLVREIISGQIPIPSITPIPPTP